MNEHANAEAMGSSLSGGGDRVQDGTSTGRPRPADGVDPATAGCHGDEALALLILLVSAATLDEWLSRSSAGISSFRLLWILLYAAAAVRLVQRFGVQWIVWTVRDQRPLLALLALTVASSAWSLVPLLTLQKAVSVCATTVLGLYIAYTCPPSRFMRVLLVFFAVLLVLSALHDFVFPSLGAHGPVEWRGIMTHKNTFGVAAALAVVLFLVGTIHPGLAIVLCSVSLFAVAQAASRTAFVVLGVDLVLLVHLTAGRLQQPHVAMVMRKVALTMVLAVAIVPLLVAPWANMLGREDPLNGRARLWAGSLQILHERPLTGYGYAIVWGRQEATLLPHIPITAHYQAMTAHNAIADIASELGIPGALIACVYLFAALASAGRLSQQTPTPFSHFALLFLVGMTVMAFSEALLLRIHSLFWILVVAISTAVTRALAEYQPIGVSQGESPR